jgi:DNA primase large subunit
MSWSIPTDYLKRRQIFEAGRVRTYVVTYEAHPPCVETWHGSLRSGQTVCDTRRDLIVYLRGLRGWWNGTRVVTGRTLPPYPEHAHRR